MTQADRRRGSRVVVFGALFGLAVGVATIVGALRLPGSTAADVGPGRLPLLIGLALVILSVVYAVLQTRAETDEKVATTRPALILLGALFAYCALIPVLGALASTGLFMVAIMLWLDGPRHWLRSVLIAAAFVGLVHLLFTWVISTPLP